MSGRNSNRCSPYHVQTSSFSEFSDCGVLTFDTATLPLQRSVEPTLPSVISQQNSAISSATSSPLSSLRSRSILPSSRVSCSQYQCVKESTAFINSCPMVVLREEALEENSERGVTVLVNDDVVVKNGHNNRITCGKCGLEKPSVPLRSTKDDSMCGISDLQGTCHNVPLRTPSSHHNDCSVQHNGVQQQSPPHQHNGFLQHYAQAQFELGLTGPNGHHKQNGQGGHLCLSPLQSEKCQYRCLALACSSPSASLSLPSLSSELQPAPPSSALYCTPCIESSSVTLECDLSVSGQLTSTPACCVLCSTAPSTTTTTTTTASTSSLAIFPCHMDEGGSGGEEDVSITSSCIADDEHHQAPLIVSSTEAHLLPCICASLLSSREHSAMGGASCITQDGVGPSVDQHMNDESCHNYHRISNGNDSYKCSDHRNKSDNDFLQQQLPESSHRHPQLPSSSQPSSSFTPNTTQHRSTFFYSLSNSCMPSSSCLNDNARAGCKRKLPRCNETICDEDEDALLSYTRGKRSTDSSTIHRAPTLYRASSECSTLHRSTTKNTTLHRSPNSLCLSALDDSESDASSEDKLPWSPALFNGHDICQRLDRVHANDTEEENDVVPTSVKRRKLDPNNCEASNLTITVSAQLGNLINISVLSTESTVVDNESEDDYDDDEKGLVIEVVTADDEEVDDNVHEKGGEEIEVKTTMTTVGAPSAGDFGAAASPSIENESGAAESSPCIGPSVEAVQSRFTAQPKRSLYTDTTAASFEVGSSSPIEDCEIEERRLDILLDCEETMEQSPIVSSLSVVFSSPQPPRPSTASTFAAPGHVTSSVMSLSAPTSSEAEATCVVNSEEAESVVEVDVVGMDMADTLTSPHCLATTTTTTTTITTNNPLQPSLNCTFSSDNVNSFSQSAASSSSSSYDTAPQISGFDHARPTVAVPMVLESNFPGEAAQELDGHNNQSGEDSTSSNDANSNDDDDDAFSNYVTHRPVRMNMLTNTPKQRKEERRKILKLSISKMRAVEDPEYFLRRSVLINNTMKRLQRELREEKMRHSGGARRAHYYGLYRRAASLHYDVLNGNNYLNGGGDGGYSISDDEPFGGFGASGSSFGGDDGGGDVREALGDSSLACRLEAASSSPVALTPSPSPCPDVLADNDVSHDAVDVGLDSGFLLSLATTTSTVVATTGTTDMDCNSSSPCPSYSSHPQAYCSTSTFSPSAHTSTYSPAASPAYVPSSYSPASPSYSPASQSYSPVADSYPASSTTDYSCDAAMKSPYCDVDAAASVSCCLEVSSTVADPVAALSEELAASPVVDDFVPSLQTACSASSTSCGPVTSGLDHFALQSPIPINGEEVFLQSPSSSVDVVGELSVPSFEDGSEPMEQDDDNDSIITSVMTQSVTAVTSSIPYYERATLPMPYLPSSPSSPSSSLMGPSSSSSPGVGGGLYEGHGVLAGGGMVRDCQSPSSSSCSSESQREKQLYADIDTVFNNLIHALGDS